VLYRFILHFSTIHLPFTDSLSFLQFLAPTGSRTSILRNRMIYYGVAIYVNGDDAASFMNRYEVDTSVSPYFIYCCCLTDAVMHHDRAIGSIITPRESSSHTLRHLRQNVTYKISLALTVLTYKHPISTRDRTDQLFSFGSSCSSRGKSCCPALKNSK